MKLDLTKLQNDTKEVEHDDCIVTVKRLTRSEKIDLSSNALGEDGKIQMGEYSKLMFVNSIEDVEGLTNEANQPITVEEHARELIWEYAPETFVNDIKDAIESFTKADEKKSELLEDDSIPTQIG